MPDLFKGALKLKKVCFKWHSFCGDLSARKLHFKNPTALPLARNHDPQDNYSKQFTVGTTFFC